MKTFSDYRALREFVAAQRTRKEWQSKFFKQKEMIKEIIWEYEQERNNNGEIKNADKYNIILLHVNF